MNTKHFLSVTTMAAALMITACGPQKADDPMAASGRTQRTENLLNNLMAYCDSGIYLFGHHDDTVYGIGWKGDSARSDVHSVCNDYPALLSFDLGHIELGDSVNLDGVSFDRMRQEIFNHFNRGGVVTLSWHLDNPLSGGTAWVADSLKPIETKTVAAVLEGGSKHEVFLGWMDKVADFLNALETPYGVRVPVIFRPWHEHTGSWFWWGQEHCTAQQYKALWKLTVNRLKEKGVVNALYAYSPGTEMDGDEARYLERYPGDDLIDVMGLDSYCFAPDADTVKIAAFASQLDKNLATVCTVARKHHKAAALTETGYEGLKTPDWWTKTLQPVLDQHPVCYVLVWRNAYDKPQHFFAPFPGQQSSTDFVRFVNNKQVLMRSDVNNIYCAKARQ